MGITVIALIRSSFKILGFLPQMASNALFDDHNKIFDNFSFQAIVSLTLIIYGKLTEGVREQDRCSV